MDASKQQMARLIKEDRQMHEDEMGWFVEMAREDEQKTIRQVSVASLAPGGIRGNHYHKKKVEWFMLVRGKAEFCLAEPFSGKKTCFSLSEENPQVITALAGVAHAIRNTGKETVYFVEADSEVYNRENPDVVPYAVFEERVHAK